MKANSILQHFKRKIGKLILSDDNREIVPSLEQGKGKKQSTSQYITHARFKSAVAYAKDAMQNEIKKAYYKEVAKMLMIPSAYVTAIKHFMLTPQGEEVNLDKFLQTAMLVKKKKQESKVSGFRTLYVRVVDNKGKLLQVGAAVAKEDEWHFKLFDEITGRSISVIIQEEGDANSETKTNLRP